MAKEAVEVGEEGWRGATRVLRNDMERSVTARTKSSGTKPFIQSRFVLLLQEAAAPVRTHSTDLKGL